MVEVFHYYKELIDLGAYAKTLSSMTLAEAHRYFHTEQKACMFPVGSWYTGRAFVAQDKGGQPKDFELGMMNYPLMKDGKGHNQKFLGVAGSLGAAAKGPNLRAGDQGGRRLRRRRDRQPLDGQDRHADRDQDRAVAKIDSPFKWYFDEYARVNKATKWVDLTAQQVRLLMKPGRVGRLRRRGEPGPAQQAHRRRRGAGQARRRAPQGQVAWPEAESLILAGAAVAPPPHGRRPWGAIAIFLGPTLLLYAAFTIYPVLVTFYNSLHSLRMDLGMQLRVRRPRALPRDPHERRRLLEGGRATRWCGRWWRRWSISRWPSCSR